MKTIILDILDSEEEAVTRQLAEWNSRQAIRIQSFDSLVLPGEPLTPTEWMADLTQAEASGTVQLTRAEALARFGV